MSEEKVHGNTKVTVKIKEMGGRHACSGFFTDKKHRPGEEFEISKKLFDENKDKLELV